MAMQRFPEQAGHKKHVGIWIRVSTEDQAKGESPEHHEKRAQYYAESKGWFVAEVYHLEGASGKSVAEHPETIRMLKDIRSGRISGLIFSKLARLARNTRELLEFADLFEAHSADLVSLQESIDTSTPAGRLFYTMIAAMAQWEREEIASRVAASVPVRARLGKPLGGQPPFGYQWENRQLVPDPKEAPVRRLLYELFAEHGRKKTVARILNEAGHRTRNGSKFSDTTVSRLIADPTAKGERRANYTKSLGEGKNWKFKPEDEWVLTSVPPIISEDLWQKCNAVLEGRKVGKKPATRKTVQLFSGIVYCECGQKMYVPSNSPKYTCKPCRTKIQVSDLEEVYRERLKDFFYSEAEIASYLESAEEAVSVKAELLNALLRERKKVSSEMDKTYQLYIASKISPDGFDRLYRPLEARLKQLDDETPVLQAEVDFLKLQALSSSEVVSEAQDLYGRWPELSFDQKRSIIESATERITVGSADIRIQLAYLPASAGNAAKGQRTNTDSSPPRA